MNEFILIILLLNHNGYSIPTEQGFLHHVYKENHRVVKFSSMLECQMESRRNPKINEYVKELLKDFGGHSGHKKCQHYFKKEVQA